MQNDPDTPYFVYLYVVTCEKCQCPHVETHVIDKAPKDEIDRNGIDWHCKNCKSPQSTALYRGAAYAKWLLVREGKCSERRSADSGSPRN